MKYMLKKTSELDAKWNGKAKLPDEINVMSYDVSAAEFELLMMICALHGHVTAFDLLTGAESETEKDRDISVVMEAFQRYIYPKMPLSNYTNKDARMRK